MYLSFTHFIKQCPPLIIGVSDVPVFFFFAGEVEIHLYSPSVTLHTLEYSSRFNSVGKEIKKSRYRLQGVCVSQDFLTSFFHEMNSSWTLINRLK